jgi:hypothetical protein
MQVQDYNEILESFKDWWNNLPDEHDDKLYMTDQTIQKFLKDSNILSESERQTVSNHEQTENRISAYCGYCNCHKETYHHKFNCPKSSLR